MKLFWTKEVLLRLQEIEGYISKDNDSTAIKFVDKLISIAEKIVYHPEKGRIVPELSIDKIREIIFKNYRIVYMTKKDSINILTLFESHQSSVIKKR